MKTELLQKQWMGITATYQSDKNLRRNIFNDLVARYNESGRFYHNLTHIETLLADLQTFYGERLPDELFFAAWFHDAIYNAMLNNNEAKSAALAVKKLQLLHVPKHSIDRIEGLILKTANHLDALADDPETQVFLDVDLKILAAEETVYNRYTKSVRQEYAIYPDILFNRGRKKFIEKALGSKRIYKSAKFFAAYEPQARKNLQNELNQLL